MKPAIVSAEARAPRLGESSRWRLFPARSFAAYLDGWESLVASRPANPVIEAPFVEAAITVFGTGKEMLAVCGDAARPDAMAIVLPKGLRGWETFQPAQHPLSAWIHRPEFSYEEMLSGLLAALPGKPLMIAVTQKDPDIHPRPRDGGQLNTLDYVRTAKILVNRSFDEYWAARSQSVRRQIDRRLKRLRADGVEPQLDVIISPEEVGPAVAEFGRLETAGWKGRAGTAVHPDNAQGAFYATVLTEFCRRGRGAIYRYRFGATTVAMELCVESGGTLVMLKTAYDETRHAHSPGMLMRRQILELAFSSRRTRKIEFLGAVQPWQAKWCDEIRALYHVNYYRSAWIGRLHRMRGAWSSRAALVDAARTIPQTAIYEKLSELPVKYQDLFGAAARLSMFHTLPWYRNFIDTVRTPGERLRIYTAEDAAGKPRAVLLMRHQAGSRALAARTLSGLSNYYTSLFGPVFDPGEADLDAISTALAIAIARDAMKWDVVDLHPLAVDDATCGALEAAFARAGFLVGRFFCFGNWYLPVSGRSFAEYFASRPSRLSKTGARVRRKLEGSGRMRFVLYTSADRIDEGLAAYQAVYSASWKVPEPHGEFIGGLLRAFAEQGWLRLGVIYIEGQPAAAQIWTLVDGTASIFKMAYDERFNKDSVGTVLSICLMEYVIDVEKAHTVDYLTGDDAYKRDWMSHRRERWGILAFNPRTPRGLLSAARHFGGRMARQMVRSKPAKA